MKTSNSEYKIYYFCNTWYYKTNNAVGGPVAFPIHYLYVFFMLEPYLIEIWLRMPSIICSIRKHHMNFPKCVDYTLIGIGIGIINGYLRNCSRD